MRTGRSRAPHSRKDSAGQGASSDLNKNAGGRAAAQDQGHDAHLAHRVGHFAGGEHADTLLVTAEDLHLTARSARVLLRPIPRDAAPLRLRIRRVSLSGILCGTGGAAISWGVEENGRDRR